MVPLCYTNALFFLSRFIALKMAHEHTTFTWQSYKCFVWQVSRLLVMIVTQMPTVCCCLCYIVVLSFQSTYIQPALCHLVYIFLYKRVCTQCKVILCCVIIYSSLTALNCLHNPDTHYMIC